LVTLKWINDVFLDGKKVAGALCRAETVGDRCLLHVGMGVNINVAPDEETQNSVRRALDGDQG